MKTILTASITDAIQLAGLSPEEFFLCGIAGFLARLHNQGTVSALYRGQMMVFSVETSAPFRDLLAQVLTPAKTSHPQTSADFHFDERQVGSPPTAQAHFMPVFQARQITQGWELTLASCFLPEATAARYLEYLRYFLESAALDLEQPTGTIRLASEETALALYRDVNRTAKVISADTVLDLVTETVAAFASTQAVLFGDAAVSYSTLDIESTAIASLLQARGASQIRPVAICMPRSEKIPVLLLAVLKAGSYFVPLDPTHPRQRLLDMLEECDPAVVMVSPQTQLLFANTGLPLLAFPLQVPAGKLPTQTVPVNELPTGDKLDHPSAPAISGSDKAYMIYTSGTTGRPKGVIITHRSLVNLLLAMRDRPGLGPGDRLLAVATLSFDISVMDMFLPMSSGATLVMASERAARDPWELSRLFETQKITCMQATPVTWRMLVSSGYAGHPRLKMLAGGEALSRDLANELTLIGHELWNCYGPTETTIYSSVLRIQKANGPVTIGPPIANTVFYVADAKGQLLPPEIAGELYIGGSGVAAGYYDRPELNADRFVEDRWTTASSGHLDGSVAPRLFRTGDQVRLAETGDIEFEFFGRLDHQVKLRGYRIELGEIEVVLRAHPSVADAAVLLREDEPGEPWLVGYITTASTAQKKTDAKELLEFAAKQLPQYMLPSRLVRLPNLPLTGSGKVDKRALAAMPAPADGVPDSPRLATVTDETKLDSVELALLRIFRDTLRLKSFGVDDSFFEFGGYSMLAIRLFARIGTVLHRQLPITALFDAPTVRTLAALIRRGNPLEALVPIRSMGHEAPFFLVHSYLLYGVAAKIVDDSRPVYGLRERSTSHASLDLERCVTDYAAAIQRASPAGTIHLGGWCAAANLTVELARRLMQEGRQVGMVALFDAEAPGFVSAPPQGSRKLARLKAMWTFHQRRLRGLAWREQLAYANERIIQVPLNLIERFYMKNHARVEAWRRSVPWLPHVILYNRFMQIGVLQAEKIEALNSRIQLFRARDVTMIQGSDEALGWSSIARDGVDVFFIPGHHESMFLEPNVAILGQTFQESMRAAEDNIVTQPSQQTQ